MIKSLKNNIINIINIFISFITTFIIMSVILFILKIIGDNGRSIFYGDLYMQYMPFIRNFLYAINGDASIWYSFSNFLGSGNILTTAYYVLNPFNLLYLISIDSLEIITILILLLKVSFSSASFCFFASKMFFYSDSKKDIWASVIISLFYGMSGFVVCIFINIMWLDIIYMLPILIYSIVKLVKEGKIIGFIISLVYIFITNFYTAYMGGVFCGLFFIGYVFHYNFDSIKNNYRIIIKSFLLFAISVIVSVGLCAIILLPTAGFLYSHIADDNFGFDQLKLSLLDIINSMFIGEMHSTNNKVPFLYCGIPAIFGMVLFFYSSDIKLKDKILYGSLFVVYIISMLNLTLYKMMHAFDYPNFWGFRFSFCLIFILLCMLSIVVKNVKRINVKFVMTLSVLLILLYSFMGTFQLINFSGQNLNSQNGLIINAFFILIWSFVICWIYKDHKFINGIQIIIVFCLVCTELFVNGLLCMKSYILDSSDDTSYNQLYYSEKELVEQIKANDNSFYRIYANNSNGMNTGKMFNYNSLNTFSSSDNFELRNAMANLGFTTSNRTAFAHSCIPGTANILAVKYRVDLPNPLSYQGMQIHKDNFLTGEYSENPYTLGLGYMVNEKVLDYGFEKNAFHNINSLCSLMIDDQVEIYTDVPKNEIRTNTVNVAYDIIDDTVYSFRQLSSSVVGGFVEFIMDHYSKNDDIYVDYYIDSPIEVENVPFVASKEYGILTHYRISMGGVYKCYDENNVKKAAITSSYVTDMNFTVNNICFGKYNESEMIKVYDKLKNNQFVIAENSNDYISGTISATEDKNIMFTSIPYDPGWHVFVDGIETAPVKLCGDAFMGVRLNSGNHVVTFQYVELYSYQGAIITLCSLFIFAIIVVVNVLSKNNKSKEEK